MKKTVSLILCFLSVCLLMAGLAACGGPSEADKAYDNWANNSLPKIEKAKSDMEAKAAEAQQSGDRDAIINATREYLSVIKSVTDELAAIDMTKLTGARKDAAPGQLSSLQASVKQLEDSLAPLESQPQEEQGAGDESWDDGLQGAVDEAE